MIPHFKLEEFWKKYEFNTPYLFCCSDCETWKMSEILSLADTETKHLWDNLTLGYTESPGLPLLRTEISKLYNSIPQDQIITFAGAEEGIYCTMRTLIQSGDHVIIVQPTYQSLLTLPEVIGADITTVSVNEENQWQLNLEDIQIAFKNNTKLILLVCPHNPTGKLISKHVMEGLIKLARERGTYIFCDEVYRFLEMDESKRLPSIADQYEKGITLNVMTKSFGLAGLRVGWLASQDTQFINEVGSYKLYTSICNSAPSEILALIGLRAKNTLLKRNRKILLDNFKLLSEFIKRNEKLISWTIPESGSSALLKLHLPLSIDDFVEKLVKEAGILIMPGTVFDLPGNYFRIGFGKKNMPEILNRFESFLTSLTKS